MGYAIGVDLGTTYTAAATYRNGRVEIATLGNRSAAIPSVVLLREDEAILTGEAANRRGASEPGRVAREFKRRVGDTTPIFLGGSPYSAEQLMARLLNWVSAEVASREGGVADHVAISYPANWGPYKKDLLAQAVRLADLPAATFLTEPAAAAVHYASQERVEPGEVVAVYDLGGGTFDVAVLRNAAGGFEILGDPEGVDRLGGIDFDAAVFAHVARSLDGKLEELDEDDPTAVAAVARLRQESVEAKEALSTDTDVSIPVMLPNVSTEVRLTRSEFESMVRPALGDSIAALRRALESARLEPGDVSTVLLVGGSSRIPLVAQMVGAELGRPVAVDTHPKHAIALGAALAAAQAGGMAGAAGAVDEDAGSDDIAGAAAAGAGAGAVAGAIVGASATSGILTGAEAVPGTDESTGAQAPDPAPAEAAPGDKDSAADATGLGVAAAAAAAKAGGAAPPPGPDDATVVSPVSPPPPPPTAPAAGAATAVVPTAAAVGAQSAAAPGGHAGTGSSGGGGAEGEESGNGVPGWLIGVGVLLLLALLAGGAILLTSGGDGDGGDVTETTVVTPTTDVVEDTSGGGDPVTGGGVPPPAAAPTTAPANPTTPTTAAAPTTTI